MAKPSVECGIDWEIDGRVEDDEHVTDTLVVELECSTFSPFVSQDVPEDLVEQRRSLADAENDDDDDQNEGDVVVLRLTDALI